MLFCCCGGRIQETTDEPDNLLYIHISLREIHNMSTPTALYVSSFSIFMHRKINTHPLHYSL